MESLDMLDMLADLEIEGVEKEVPSAVSDGGGGGEDLLKQEAAERDMFAVLDTDGDGMVSVEEIEHGLGVSREDAVKMLRKYGGKKALGGGGLSAKQMTGKKAEKAFAGLSHRTKHQWVRDEDACECDDCGTMVEFWCSECEACQHCQDIGRGQPCSAGREDEV
jgi:hypothetical protein